MKHIFIINPAAGKKDLSKSIKEQLTEFDGKIDYEIYITQNTGDATNYIREYCQNYHDEIRFYSCGGDGTLNEVVNGIVGFSNAAVACYPSGSGNDFIKVFGERKNFLNFDNLINGQEKKVDIIKINDRYTLNICNFGFDGVIADNMRKFKRLPLVSGKGAYRLALIYSILTKMKYECKVRVDGELFYDGLMLLCALANGICYGGGYYCAPMAKVDDGLIDICLVRKIHRIRFITLVGVYKKGKHLSDKRLKNIVKYAQAKHIEITSNMDLVYTLDGEVGKTKALNVSIIEKRIRFIIPRNLEY